MLQRLVLGPLCFTFSWMTWMIEHCAYDTKSEELVDTANGFVAIHNDLNRQRKWADSNFIVFKRGKCQVLYLGRSYEPTQVGAYCPEISWVKKDLVDNMRNMREQSALAAKKANGFLDCIRKSTASLLKEDVLYSDLMNTHVLNSLLQERHRHAWASPVKSHKHAKYQFLL